MTRRLGALPSSVPYPLPRQLRGSSCRPTAVLAVLALLALITPLASMAFGAAHVPLDQVASVLWSHSPWGAPLTGEERLLDAIIWLNRAPRVFMGVAVGAILGLSGVVLQAMVRNPLAEPYVLGVSSGASCGAAVAMVIIGTTSTLGVSALAFVGASAATVLVLAFGGRRGCGPLHLVLAGLAVGFILQALTNLVIFSSKSPETARAVMFWTLGSLARANWSQLAPVAITAVVLGLVFLLAAPLLDALASGDGTATAVGLNPSRVRLLLTLVVSAGVALAVAASGGIGFVGLVIPHLVRSWVGHGHRRLVIGSALAGGIFLAWADAFSRTIFSPAEIPIGVVTGLLGAPFLLVLLRRGARGA